MLIKNEGETQPSHFLVVCGAFREIRYRVKQFEANLLIKVRPTERGRPNFWPFRESLIVAIRVD